MNTKRSEIELEADDGAAGISATSLVRPLGEVKVETKAPTGSDVIDSVTPLEHYAQ
jgi:hypothetical protein